MQVRVPAIIRETAALNHFPPDMHDALEALARELESGLVRLLEEKTPDRAFWQAAWGEWAGRPWLDAPWYLSESYAYRRILQATRYFQPGEWYGFDPFRVKKLTELEPQVAPRLVEATLRALPAEASQCFEVLLHSSLWGNRIDLSYAVSARQGRAERLEDERANLLVDDTEAVSRFLHGKPGQRIAFLLDNSGTELAMDLTLADGLLQSGLAAQIDLHLKPQPFFVSDAMPYDVDLCLDALARTGGESRALVARLRAHLAAGRLRLLTHWFNATCLFYLQMPDDLYADLAANDLVIVKGDANYRRLVGDCHWPPTASFQRATAYFPAPLVALRTLKCELILGLGEGEAERQSRLDPQWRVNGKRGVVQANLVQGG
jgi:uncharacterized protein with ATP-grasp and redox domains